MGAGANSRSTKHFLQSKAISCEQERYAISVRMAANTSAGAAKQRKKSLKRKMVSNKWCLAEFESPSAVEIQSNFSGFQWRIG